MEKKKPAISATGGIFAVPKAGNFLGDGELSILQCPAESGMRGRCCWTNGTLLSNYSTVQ